MKPSAAKQNKRGFEDAAVEGWSAKGIEPKTKLREPQVSHGGVSDERKTDINRLYKKTEYAGVVELADTPDLGSGISDVQVQVLSPAPSLNSLNLFTVGRMFGLFCFMEDFNKFSI